MQFAPDMDMDMEIAPDAEFLSPLLGLPDDALLAVLAYLTYMQLLDCRRVCRRLRDICLHPDLWRSVSIVGADAALRLAPCVGKVIFGQYDEENPIACAATIMATSKCIIKSMELILDETDVAAAAILLRRVSDLGGLEELVIDYRGEATEFSFDLDMTPSLVSLTYDGGDDLNQLLRKLLTTHAATLQHVLLGPCQHFPCSLLLSMPNLRSLSCSGSVNLEMLSSATIDTVELESDGTGYSPGALAFLSKASQLRSVSLNCSKTTAAPVLALASSPSANMIETLKLENVTPADLKHVAASLQHFPSLKTLELGLLRVVPSHFRFVSPSTAPSLSMLKLVDPKRNMCPHAFLHGPAVQDVLTRNPGLHVRLVSWCVPVHCKCQWCKFGCRAESSGWLWLAYSSSSHKREAGCPSDCNRITMLCPSRKE